MASNVPNLFFKVKRLQINQVCNKVTLALQCFRTKGKKLKQSCAETKWPELLRSLGQLVDNKTYTDQEIESMDWQTKCRLIKGDSPTVVRYFEHRFLQFFNLVVKSAHKPIHDVTDYFMRIELLDEEQYIFTGLPT